MFVTSCCAILSEAILMLINRSGYSIQGNAKDILEEVVQELNSRTPESLIFPTVVTIFLFITLCTYIKAYKFTKEVAILKKQSGNTVFMRDTPSKSSICHGPVINIESFDQEFNRVDRHRP